jgi:hypothetical protein
MAKSDDVATSPERKFIGMAKLCQRWDCSHMFIERKIKSDPAFPRVYRLVGQRRLFALDEIEEYERRCAPPR